MIEHLINFYFWVTQNRKAYLSKLAEFPFDREIAYQCLHCGKSSFAKNVTGFQPVKKGP